MLLMLVLILPKNVTHFKKFTIYDRDRVRQSDDDEHDKCGSSWCGEYLIFIVAAPHFLFVK